MLTTWAADLNEDEAGGERQFIIPPTARVGNLLAKRIYGSDSLMTAESDPVGYSLVTAQSIDDVRCSQVHAALGRNEVH